MHVDAQQLENLRELSDDPPDDVRFETLYGLRTIILNRKDQLNALTASMIRKIVARLREWSRSELANVVIIKGAGQAFCAGGDVKTLAGWNEQGVSGVRRSSLFFGLEYAMNHYIATYNHPYVAFMDGVTMGGGVGISFHAPFRICTENTVFAMPETKIGFFPDVGGSFFLNRLDGGMGTYLGLTGARVQGVHCYLNGLATHFLQSSQLLALEHRLAELRFYDYDSYETRCHHINNTINEFAVGLPSEDFHNSGETRILIDRIFSQSSVLRIMQDLYALAVDFKQPNEWAVQTLKLMQRCSPTALLVAMRQLRMTKDLTIGQALDAEYQLAARFMAHPDFTEGVKALLSRKKGTEPKWKMTHEQLMKLGNPNKFADSFFLDTPDNLPDNLPDLTLWNKRDFEDYPLRFGVPNEMEVKKFIESTEGRTSKDAVIQHMAKKRGVAREHAGVVRVTRDILRRCTEQSKVESSGKGVRDDEDSDKKSSSGKLKWVMGEDGIRKGRKDQQTLEEMELDEQAYQRATEEMKKRRTGRDKPILTPEEVMDMERKGLLEGEREFLAMDEAWRQYVWGSAGPVGERHLEGEAVEGEAVEDDGSTRLEGERGIEGDGKSK